MLYLSKFLGAVIVVVFCNYLVISYLPPISDVVGDRLLSIFPPIWENVLNAREISFGWTTSYFLVLLFIFTIILKKIETKNPFTNDFCILLISMGFIIDGTFNISILFVTLYAIYIIWEYIDCVFGKCIDEDPGPTILVAFFAIMLFYFSAFVIRYRDISPNLDDEALIFLVVLFIVRFVKQYYSNFKEKIITIAN